MISVSKTLKNGSIIKSHVKTNIITEETTGNDVEEATYRFSYRKHALVEKSIVSEFSILVKEKGGSWKKFDEASYFALAFSAKYNGVSLEYVPRGNEGISTANTSILFYGDVVAVWDETVAETDEIIKNILIGSTDDREAGIVWLKTIDGRSTNLLREIIVNYGGMLNKNEAFMTSFLSENMQ